MTQRHIKRAADKLMESENESRSLREYCAEAGVEFTNDFKFKVMQELQVRWQVDQRVVRVKLFDEG